MTREKQVLSKSRRKLGGEFDHFTLVIFNGRKLHCGQHGNNSRPHWGISSIPAWSKNVLAHAMQYGNEKKLSRPGHLRRPKPKQYSAGSSSVSAPSASMNLSGINTDALGYRFSSRVIPLQHNVSISKPGQNVSDHMLHMTVAPDVWCYWWSAH